MSTKLDETITQMRIDHRPHIVSVYGIPQVRCVHDDTVWPCESSQLLKLIDEQRLQLKQIDEAVRAANPDASEDNTLIGMVDGVCIQRDHNRQVKDELAVTARRLTERAEKAEVDHRRALLHYERACHKLADVRHQLREATAQTEKTQRDRGRHLSLRTLYNRKADGSYTRDAHAEQILDWVPKLLEDLKNAEKRAASAGERITSALRREDAERRRGFELGWAAAMRDAARGIDQADRVALEIALDGSDFDGLTLLIEGGIRKLGTSDQHSRLLADLAKGQPEWPRITSLVDDRGRQVGAQVNVPGAEYILDTRSEPLPYHSDSKAPLVPEVPLDPPSVRAYRDRMRRIGQAFTEPVVAVSDPHYEVMVWADARIGREGYDRLLTEVARVAHAKGQPIACYGSGLVDRVVAPEDFEEVINPPRLTLREMDLGPTDA